MANVTLARLAGAAALALLLAAALAPPVRASHGKPTGVTVALGFLFDAKGFTVSWTASSGADGYKIQWKDGTQDWGH